MPGALTSGSTMGSRCQRANVGSAPLLRVPWALSSGPMTSGSGWL
jgi:hypothetical protein